MDTSINHRIQEIDERILDAEDTVDSIETIIELEKCTKQLFQNIQKFRTK